MLNVRLLVKDLDEVEVAVVGLLQLVQRELEVDLLLLLRVLKYYQISINNHGFLSHVIMCCPIRDQY